MIPSVIRQIDRIGEASTGDITYQDYTKLLNGECPILNFAGEYGFIVWIPQDDIQQTLERIADLGFSEKFISLINAAITQKLRYLKFDRDGACVFESQDPSWDTAASHR